MKLPSMIKGWLNTNVTPECLLDNYVSTGDKKYIVTLVEQFNTAIYHYLYSLSDKETAEDALQTMWLKVIKVQAKSTSHTNVKSWLYTIARNTLIDELRYKNKWQYSSLQESSLDSCTLSAEFEAKERIDKFNLALNQLPFYQREAFIFYQEGFSVLEICQLTDENYEAIKSRLRYARKHLKKVLGTNHE